MDREQMESSLKEIRHLLSHLHGEVTALESSYSQVLSVLRQFEGAADFDDLTGLMRRRAFFRKWEALLNECQRLGDNCGVLMVDIDHFKRVNDTHGHLVGDRALVAVSKVLQAAVRVQDILGRYGGEEFAIIMPHTERDGGEMAVERCRKQIEQHALELEGRPLQLTASMGMVCYPRPDVQRLEDLISLADAAMYRAKEAGRNRVVTSEPPP